MISESCPHCPHMLAGPQEEMNRHVHPFSAQPCALSPPAPSCPQPPWAHTYTKEIHTETHPCPLHTHKLAAQGGHLACPSEAAPDRCCAAAATQRPAPPAAAPSAAPPSCRVEHVPTGVVRRPATGFVLPQGVLKHQQSVNIVPTCWLPCCPWQLQNTKSARQASPKQCCCGGTGPPPSRT
jgi:hypothetical protein